MQVLRRYPWLWCMDRPANKRPPLYIVNLQWTPKDATATLKINGRCDFVLAEVLANLNMKIPEYTPYNDPLLSFATHLHEKEEHTTSRRTLIESKPVGVTQLSMTAAVSPSGVITEVRVRDQFTTAKTEFQHMSSERPPAPAESTDDADTETETDEAKAATEDEEDTEHEAAAEHPAAPATNGDHCEGTENAGDTMQTESPSAVKHEPGDSDQDDATIHHNNEDTKPHINEDTTPQHHNHEDTAPLHHSNGVHVHHQDPEVSKLSPATTDSDSSQDEEDAAAAGSKKPKLESLNDCDKEGFDPLGKVAIEF